MEKNCKVVQDLLPTYIEKLTSSETNAFIEEHLNECKECNDVYNKMLSNIEKEKIENTEIVKQIKKYRLKIILLKLLIIIAILGVLGSITYKIGYRFYIVNKAYERNTNYDVNCNFTIAEYDQSIEYSEKHYVTYWNINGHGGIMKKMYGDEVVEYYDNYTHYYIDNENKTYYIDYEIIDDMGINIDISIINSMKNIIKDGKVNKLEILKFVIFNDDIYIQKEGFRDKEYYIIKNRNNEKIYLDKDTFYAERIESKDYKKEYRITTASVSWIETKEPDLSEYTLVEKP